MQLKYSYLAAALLGCIISVAATPINVQDVPSKRRIFNYEPDLDVISRRSDATLVEYVQRSEYDSDKALGAFGKRDPATDKALGAFGKREPATDKALGAFGKREAATDKTLGAFGKREASTDKALGAFGKREPATDKALGAFGRREASTDKVLGAFGKRGPSEAIDRPCFTGRDEVARGAFGKRDPLGATEDVNCKIII